MCCSSEIGDDMHKFFVDSKQKEENYIYINKSDLNHIKNVLRLDIGDKILISESNYNHLCSIKKYSNEKVICKILESNKSKNEPNINLTLFQGLAKGQKIEHIIQKGTEIGIKNFYIVDMDRSIVKPKGEKWKDKRLSRYRKIAKEASKQCKRDYIPNVLDIITNNEMIEILKGKYNKSEEIIIPYEQEKDNQIKKILKKINTCDINIIIGPEGGFSNLEIKKLKEIEGKTVSLSNRILRTETAGLVASTIVLYELGDGVI